MTPSTKEITFAKDDPVGKKAYVPNTTSILESKKGICYDYAALFAALCRSQNIPCSIEKGYYYGGYHAWNKVYLNDTWYTMDLMMDSSFHVINATALEDCVITLTADSGYKYAK
ncbi:MAG: transglutaminase domain-containing protein [Clostridia bacterium]|nr:transglutaminase domain-containing protein [Clostridia bacterium]